MQQDVEYDEFCDPARPRTVFCDDILVAAKRIAGYVRYTPCTKANMSKELKMDLYLKQECTQHTGSFKERGVVNTLLSLSDEQKKIGVIAASTGNHAQAVTYHSTQLGIPSIVVMPITAPLTKLNRCQKFGAKTILNGNSIAEAKRHACILRQDNKMMYLNGYDHPNVIEGQGTVGLEILEQVPDVDAILVPCGGGSLLAGICVAVKHLKPDTQIYGIESNKTSSMIEALKKNERVYVNLETSIADGLSVNMVGVNSFHNVKDKVDKMVVVKEDWVARAVMHVVEKERFIIEGAAATGIAAIMAGLFPDLEGKKVVCLLSGGNIDTTTLARCLERGMALEGRLVKFKVTVTDRPGGMAEFCRMMGKIGVTIKDCIPERAWVKGDIFSCELKVIAETKGWDHTNQMIEHIKRHYTDYFFPEFGERRENRRAKGSCLARNPRCMEK
ncbi:L-threonine ammonia-lyase-like [Aricia agestis]|uniref:L-threonine ammonia-lyase-like n=1 Tax=Aricia agestis TaxID=91739 RepID=UPI001C204199|nr:L-threonine ammonia-lyase-like [Aricia agestis]